MYMTWSTSRVSTTSKQLTTLTSCRSTTTGIPVARVLRYDRFHRCFVVDVSQVDQTVAPAGNVLEQKMASVLGHNVSKSLDKYQDIKDFCLILKLYPMGSFSPEFMQLFEDALFRFLSLPDQRFDLQDLTYLFHLVSGTKRRPIKVMKRLSELIMSDTQVVDNERSKVKHEYICLMVYAMQKTMFLDVDLLQKLCDILTRDSHRLVDVKKNTMTSLLIALGQMRFRHVPLMDAITSLIPLANTSRKPLNPNAMMALVNTLARINYRPPHLTDVCVKHVLPNVGLDLIAEEAVVDFVWSLSFFKLADDHIIGYLLNPNGRIMRRINDRIVCCDTKVWADVAKLQNIRSVAVNEMGFTCPELQLPVDSVCKVCRSHDCSVFASTVIDTFNLFIPKGSHMQTGVTSEFGFEIDARFYINASLKTLSLDDVRRLQTAATSGDDDVSKGSLPDGYVLVNVLTASFRTTLSNESSGIAGQLELQRRLLKNVAKQAVVVVDAANLMSKSDAVTRVNYLQQLIRNALVQV